MRVGFVVDVDFPHVGEVRPGKIGQSLYQIGHQVVFICANQRTKPPVEDLSFGRVHRFAWFVRSTWFPWLSATLPINPLWILWIASVARKEKLDVLISSNLRLALPTILAAKWLGLPAVVDLQENNREAVKLYSKTKWHHHLIRNSQLVGFLEDLCVRLADHTWVVVQERLASLPAKPRAQGRISVVCHTPSTEILSPGASYRGKRDHDTFNLIYIGLFSPGVGSIEPVLEALPYVLAKDKGVRFLVGGGGEHLLPLIRRLGIQDHVSFEGVIDSANVAAWLRRGDVGVIAYPVNAFTSSTISNKVFHYMAAGLPILSTDMAPTTRILKEVGCGVTIPEGSGSREIADIILSLKDSPAERAAMGRRGREAVAAQYNWSSDFGHALNCLEGLVAMHKKGGAMARPSAMNHTVSNHGS